MELKTTLFAIFLILVFNWRNKKISDLYGREYKPYGLGDIRGIIPESLTDKIKKLKNKEQSKAGE